MEEKNYIVIFKDTWIQSDLNNTDKCLYQDLDDADDYVKKTLRKNYEKASGAEICEAIFSEDSFNVDVKKEILVSYKVSYEVICLNDDEEKIEDLSKRFNDLELARIYAKQQSKKEDVCDADIILNLIRDSRCIVEERIESY